MKAGTKMKAKLTLDEFRKRLKADRYGDSTGAKRAAARIKNEDDHKKALDSIKRAFPGAKAK